MRVWRSVLASNSVALARNDDLRGNRQTIATYWKEAYLGVERIAGIHGWSFDHSGVYPAGLASVQAEECT